MRTHRLCGRWGLIPSRAGTAALALVASVVLVPTARAKADTAPAPAIAVGAAASPLERHAAAELRRYLYEMSGSVPQIVTVGSASDRPPAPTIAVGTAADNPILADLVARGSLPDRAHAPGAEGYVVQTVDYQGSAGLAVLGTDARGVLYGSYRLLEQYGARFYLNRDVLPPGHQAFAVRQVNLTEAPSVAHRGLLPWHDFLNGPSGYSYADYKRYVDQMAKMRMNTLVLHDYMGGYPGNDIDEPFISMACKGTHFHGYFDTSVSNQRWGLSATTADGMAGRAGDYMPYQVMASDAARDTDNQPDAGANTFAKAQDMLNQTIRYASSEGIDIVLGTDFDLLPRALTDAGCKPLDPAVLNARLDSIMSTYPTLKYIQMYFNESSQTTTQDAINAYQVMHDYLAAKYPGVRLVTGSWFLEQRFTDMDPVLPKDVIFSTLMPHDMTVKPEWGQVARARQAWAIPWMEFDGGLSEPQLAVERMSTQLPQLRAAGVTGSIGILWRERPAEPNVAYLAQDAWQPVGKVLDPQAFYRDYAAHTMDLSDTQADSAAGIFSDLERKGAYGAGLYGYGPTTPEYGGWRFGAATDAVAQDRATTFGALADRFAALRPSAVQGVDSRDFWASFMRWTQQYWNAEHKVPAASQEALPRSDNYFLAAAGSSSGEKDLLPDSAYQMYGDPTSTFTTGGTVDPDFGYPGAIRSERWTSGTFGYRYPVPGQYDRYRVELYFQEGWFGTSNAPGDPVGKRVFDIVIDGTTVQSNFDIAKAAGGSLKGVKLQFDVPVPADHVLDISFHSVVSNAKADLIRAYPIDASGQPLPETFPPNDPGKAWDDLKGSGVTQALDAYQQSVRDVPSLGGLLSAAGGRWMYPDNGSTFVSYEKTVVDNLDAPPPDHVVARGTPDGARVTWQPWAGKTDGITGFRVWRAPAGGGDYTAVATVPATARSFTDRSDRKSSYAVSTVLAGGKESPRSFESTVDAGSADRTAPSVLVWPAASQGVIGEDYTVAATAVDGREGKDVSVTLHYRRIGDSNWHTAPMRRNVRGEPYTFYAALPGSAVTDDGVEYYVSASDGANTGSGPAAGADQPLSLTGVPAFGDRPSPARALRVTTESSGSTLLTWRTGLTPAFEYRVYRSDSEDGDFAPGPQTYLTYVPGTQLSFRDSTAGPGRHYTYAVVPVSKDDRTGAPVTP